MKRIGVLISGGGTNLQALIDKQGTVLKSGKIVCVCSNNSKAYGLERAKNAGIATKVIRKNADCGGDNDEFNRQICAYMKEMDVDVIVLAGFLAILGGDLLKEYANKIVNIHPSLIPSFCGDGFYGLKVHQAALDYGVKVTGATAHLVNEITDGGRILLQKRFILRMAIRLKFCKNVLWNRQNGLFCLKPLNWFVPIWCDYEENKKRRFMDIMCN